MTTAGAPPDPVPLEALEQAARWLLRSRAGAMSDHEQRRWQAWRLASSDNERAWQRAQSLLDKLGGIDAHGAAALRGVQQPPSPPRRRLLGPLGLAAALGLGLLVRLLQGDETSTPTPLAAYQSPPGRRRELLLPDGTRLVMNAGAALDLDFDARQRRIRLHQGEVWVQTAADPAGRPFSIDTAAGRALALGTRYTVRVEGSDAQVGVLQGRVRLLPRDGGAGRELTAGEAARFSTPAQQPSAPYAETDAAWTRGLLVVNDQRLDQLVAELARYSGRPIHIAPALAAWRISGTFSLDDPERSLRSLARSLPLVVLAEDHGLQLVPRSAAGGAAR